MKMKPANKIFEMMSSEQVMGENKIKLPNLFLNPRRHGYAPI